MELKFKTYQARHGGIMLPNGQLNITLTRNQAEMISLYDLEDFSQEDFNKYYGDGK